MALEQTGTELNATKYKWFCHILPRLETNFRCLQSNEKLFLHFIRNIIVEALLLKAFYKYPIIFLETAR